MKALRLMFASLLLFVALNAFGGGWYGMSGAKGLPLEWLRGTPFASYFFPGLFLFAVVGGTCLVNSLAAFWKKTWATKMGLFSGVLLLSWIIIQVGMIGYVSWLQPFIFMAGITVFVLAAILNRQATA